MDIKNILMDSLLHICKTTPLKMISIKQLLDDTKMSRQTFYNHFVDKSDLIQYTYNTKIVSNFTMDEMNITFADALLTTFENIKENHSFMKQACMMDNQNCLKDYIFEHCKDFDLAWHQSLYGEKEMPDTLRFATIYHATASSSMTLSWILSDMPVSCTEIVNMIVEMRSIGMDILFKDGCIKGNPYINK